MCLHPYGFRARLRVTYLLHSTNTMPHKILIVDDDMDNLKLIGLMLQRQGYEVSAASTGGQALTKIAGDQPDLVILDVMMPDMNGYEVCRRLRTNPGTKHIPIIMFTAKTLIDDKVAGFEAGADDYLTKPTHPAELASRIQAILQSVPRQEATSTSAGTVIGVYGVKGGIGATTLALNLASAYREAGERPIVADFRLGASTLGLMLGMENSGSMASVLGNPTGELTPEFLARELHAHEDGLRLLMASALPGEAQMNIRPEAAQAVISGLRRLGSPVIVDLGNQYTQTVQRLIDAMDRVILLVEPTAMGLYLAKAMLDMNADAGIVSRFHVTIMSRYAGRHNANFSWQSIESTLNSEISAMIAAVPDLAMRAIAAGEPMLSVDSDSIFSSQVRKLAHLISDNVTS